MCIVKNYDKRFSLRLFFIRRSYFWCLLAIRWFHRLAFDSTIKVWYHFAYILSFSDYNFEEVIQHQDNFIFVLILIFWSLHKRKHWEFRLNLLNFWKICFTVQFKFFTFCKIKQVTDNIFFVWLFLGISSWIQKYLNDFAPLNILFFAVMTEQLSDDWPPYI